AFAFAFAFAFALLAPGFAFAGETKPVRVGIIMGFTGDWASVNDAVRNGMEMALKKLPAETRAKMQIFYEDDAADARKTVSAFQSLRSLHNINVVITCSSTTSKALAPIADQTKTPMLSIATDPAVSAARKYVVNFWTTDEEEVKALLPEVKRRGMKRIARITSIHDMTLAVKKSFDRQNNGVIGVALDEEYSPAEKQFTTYLAKVRADKSVDGIFVLLLPGQLGVFAKQARQQGVTLPLFGVEFFEDSAEVKVSDGALIGSWYTNAVDPEESFWEHYKKEYPNSSLFGAPVGHDLILLLGAAVKQSTEIERINRYLHDARDFTGVLGTFSATNDNRFAIPSEVKIITQDGFKPLARK
ncbi:MAG TPA: ABC transporter substrate-binding protein, partial [Oligoflexia bacterium]|nr:ABC transporter substrate-binding protein [Oligoflexia bacterium]